MPMPMPPTIDWDAAERAIERLAAAAIEPYRHILHRVPRDMLRRRVLDRMGSDVAVWSGDPYRDERFFEVCRRALDRALDAYYGPAPAPAADP